MSDKSSIWNDIAGQLVALATFFAFPACQYFVVKRFSRKEGRPELWYLPAYGFRLVIRNIPNKRVLSDVKARTIIRQEIAANALSSVSTYLDVLLIEEEDFMLLPETDKILVCFKLVGTSENDLKLIHTDKLGNALTEFGIERIDELISDYSANVENLFNFDIKILKRATVSKANLIAAWNTTNQNNREQRLDCVETIEVG